MVHLPGAGHDDRAALSARVPVGRRREAARRVLRSGASQRVEPSAHPARRSGSRCRIGDGRARHPRRAARADRAQGGGEPARRGRPAAAHDAQGARDASEGPRGDGQGAGRARGVTEHDTAPPRCRRERWFARVARYAHREPQARPGDAGTRPAAGAAGASARDAPRSHRASDRADGAARECEPRARDAEARPRPFPLRRSRKRPRGRDERDARGARREPRHRAHARGPGRTASALIGSFVHLRVHVRRSLVVAIAAASMACDSSRDIERAGSRRIGATTATVGQTAAPAPNPAPDTSPPALRRPAPPNLAALPPTPLVATPDTLRGLYVNRWAAIGTSMWRLIDDAKETEINALVIDVKDDRGLMLYRTDVALAREIGADTTNPMSHTRLRAVLDSLRAHRIYPIARIVVAKDPLLASTRQEWAIRRRDDSTNVWL